MAGSSQCPMVLLDVDGPLNPFGTEDTDRARATWRGGVNATDSDLAFAHRLADAADAIALRHFATGDTAWHAKSDGSPVSVADEQIERALRTLIGRDRPGDGVLGEELGASGHARRRWIIDAIDGTASFLAGEPEWSTLIALEDEDVVILGLVSAPSLRRRWWAARGSGAWTRSTARADSVAQPLVVAGAKRLGEASIGIWPPPPRLSPAHAAIAARLAATARAIRPAVNWTAPALPNDPIRKPSTGTGTCHGALLVATGQLDAFLLLGAGLWDVAPLVPIIEEAGGSYSDLSATPRSSTVSALFTNPALREQILNVSDG